LHRPRLPAGCGAGLGRDRDTHQPLATPARRIGTPPMSERAADRSRISMKEAHQVRYWTEALGCSKDELAAAVAFARLNAFCKRLGDRIGDTRIGDVLSEEEAQKAWQDAASVIPAA
jgi:uncharacterized protein DUF3606